MFCSTLALVGWFSGWKEGRLILFLITERLDGHGHGDAREVGSLRITRNGCLSEML